MKEARRERIRELIRSLESVRLRRHAFCEEDSAFEGRSSFSSGSAAGKSRKMQPIPPAKTGTASKAPSNT